MNAMNSPTKTNASKNTKESKGSKPKLDSKKPKKEDPTEKIQKLTQEVLYWRAELENYRKKVEQQKSNWYKYGSEDLILQVLDLLENLRMSLQAKGDEKNIEVFYKGVEMSMHQFSEALKNFSVTQIPCETGSAFDPSLHEAIGQQETEKYPPGHIVSVAKHPYKLHDRLIRPASVIVSRKPEKKK